MAKAYEVKEFKIPEEIEKYESYLNYLEDNWYGWRIVSIVVVKPGAILVTIEKGEA